jgi:hypothetical protein
MNACAAGCARRRWNSLFCSVLSCPVLSSRSRQPFVVTYRVPFLRAYSARVAPSAFGIALRRRKTNINNNNSRERVANHQSAIIITYHHNIISMSMSPPQSLVLMCLRFCLAS